MAIVQSSIDDIGIQKDGRRWIRETHTDQVGLKYVHTYLTGAVDDINVALAAYAVQLGIDLTTNEVNANITSIKIDGSLAVVAFIYSTPAQNRTAFRQAYMNSMRVEAVMIGDFLSSLTDPQLQTAFSLSAGQVTTLRTNKLTPAAATATAIRASAGQ